jgi:hypothetical protein
MTPYKRRLKAHRQDVTAALFLPDGQTAVSTGLDGLAIVWDLAVGTEVRRLTYTGGSFEARHLTFAVDVSKKLDHRCAPASSASFAARTSTAAPQRRGGAARRAGKP